MSVPSIRFSRRLLPLLFTLPVAALGASVAPPAAAPAGSADIVASGGPGTLPPHRAAQKAQVHKYTTRKAGVAGLPAGTAARKTPAAAKPKPAAHDPKAARVLDVAGLGVVTVYAPEAPARGLALFASGDGGWNLGVWDMARAAAELGYWVAGFSAPAFLKAIESGDGDCSDAAGLLDRLGATLQAEFKLPADWRPVLIGYSSGATVMYAALAQAGDARFGGAMTLGFCPDLVVHRPFCAGAGLSAGKQTKPPYGIVFDAVPAVAAPWIVLQGEIDQVCNPPATQAFVAQVRGASIVMLPKVGHGYGVPRNWMPQYRQGLGELLDSGPAPGVASDPH